MLASTRNQLTDLWKKQTKAQRITVLALLAAGLILIPVLLTWASKPSYAVAYKGLGEADAAQIVQKLDENQVAYTLENTGTILVPSEQVYQVRLMMARDGLPQTSTVGYELFDGNMLGMTEFSQRVNYQRALEGELERTIANLAAVQAVRVHIVTPAKSLLASEQEPATASVTVQQKQGRAIDAAQVRAIAHLVASSVEGLKPENVVLVDTEGNLLSGVLEEGMQSAAGQSDSQRAAEVAAASEVKKRVQSMLDKVLGPNRYVAQASVQMDWNQKEISSSVFDPTPIAVRSSHKVNELYDANGQLIGGVPGAATNLPTPLPGVVATPGTGVYQRAEETINYEISQTETREKVVPGQVRQISVSIMVDNVTDPAQMESIKAAAAAAAGIDLARGDQIVVENMNFDKTYYASQAAELEEQQQQEQYIQWGAMAAGALVLLALLVYFLRTLSRVRARSMEGWRPVLMPVSELALQQGAPLYGLPAFPADVPQAALPQYQPPALSRSDDDLMPEMSTRSAGASFPEDEQKARMIQKLTEENPTAVAEIIQIWLSEDERRNA